MGYIFLLNSSRFCVLYNKNRSRSNKTFNYVNANKNTPRITERKSDT